MQKTFLTLILALLAFFANAQLKPVIIFTDDPITHNMHIASDGKYYYAINGGKSNVGVIRKYSLSGLLVESYPFDLDMRSIMYESNSGEFYISDIQCNIYKITSFQKRTYKVVLEKLFTNSQSGPALSPDGTSLYCLEDSTLKVYSFPSGKIKKEIKGISCGPSFAQGSVTVAVDNKFIYTWDSQTGLVFIFDLRGKKIKQVLIEKGTFGPSLSFANGFIFVADDGNYNPGTWYGYDLSE